MFGFEKPPFLKYFLSELKPHGSSSFPPSQITLHLQNEPANQLLSPKVLHTHLLSSLRSLSTVVLLHSIQPPLLYKRGLKKIPNLTIQWLYHTCLGDTSAKSSKHGTHSSMTQLFYYKWKFEYAAPYVCTWAKWIKVCMSIFCPRADALFPLSLPLFFSHR